MADSNFQVNQLRATLSKMEIALGKVEECIVWTNVRGQIKWCNAAFDRFLGQSHLFILGASLTEKLPLFLDGQAVPARNHPVALALSTRSSGKQWFEFRLANQPPLFLEIAWSFVEIGNDLTTAEDASSAVLVVRDITQQRRSQVQLQATNEALEQLVAVRTQELREANLRLEFEAAQLQQLLTELQQTQAQLIQAEKMSGLGQLVAGIAHEINNPVNFIHGNLDYLKERMTGLLHLIALYQQYCPQPIAEIQAASHAIDLNFLQIDLPNLLASMQTGTERICQIVRSLRNFSRIDEAEFKAVDIHEGIESTLLILQHRLRPQANDLAINIVRNYGDLPLVECYVGQLNQVLMNILVNAIDALEEQQAEASKFERHHRSNCITIETSRFDQHWVQIAIADNGPGMSESIRQRVFNPFFTTKPVGKGTGMGMAISYQIITEKHKGKLECFTTLGKGTEFVIQIPVLQQK